MKKLILQRYSDNGKSTLGLLLEEQPLKPKFHCFTLEDEHRDKKVYGETRIKAGIYEIKLQTAGNMHSAYKSRFKFHQGMLHLQGVPEFAGIFMHIGNHDKDTLGCILTGDTADWNKDVSSQVLDSTNAYKRVYQDIVKYLLAGEKVFIDIRDEVRLNG